MGIPAFYRWLVERYPLSVVEVKEEASKLVNGVEIPIDTSKPNPNGIEFDNLYLDMNGIIHPCFHPDDMPPPSSYDEVYKAVFKYVDRIFSLVRPRKLLFMAIDGVAPRAKMNQQRARRFRAAKDAADAAAEVEKSKDESENKLVPKGNSNKKLDSNVITPGTEFMASLSNALQYYIQLRLNTDPGWKGIKVILSDSNVPGEGEHKVASYIRLQRNLRGFDPNMRHCLYGLDADLIMLGLATHEIHFSILREDVRAKQNERRQNFGNKNNSSNRKSENKEINKENLDSIEKIKFQFMHIWILREYLEQELRIPDAPLKIELNRIIDDFVFICLFVGNDFLPHIPSLAISEGALDLLINVYKKEFSKMGGYLTNSFEINLGRVEHFLQVLGSHETAIFRRRLQVKHEREIRFGKDTPTGDSELNNGNSWMSGSEETDTSISKSSFQNESYKKDKLATIEEGWKERYYNEKFEVETAEDRTKVKNHTVLKYVEGICWFMHYYYQGVCSWNWYYPYHYAPFASDFIDLKNIEIKFTIGQPFKPFDQLMGVLPAASAHALPSTYRKLMTEPSSSIIDFYPHDFEIDLNGKRFSWQAVCKLPFIDESRLLEEIQTVELTLTDEERKRNSCGHNALLFHASHPLAPKIISFYKKRKDHPKLTLIKLKRKLNPKLSSCGMNGTIYISEKTVQSSEIYSPIEGVEPIKNNQTIFVYYKFPPDHEHISRIPEGAIIPKRIITKRNLVPEPVLWHERTALHRRIYSVRPVHKSLGGNNLSRLSHQLVSNHYHGNQNQNIVKKGKILGKRKRKEEKSHERGERGKIENNYTNVRNAPITNSESASSGRKRRKRRKGNKEKRKMES